jgi:hypothetical protein
LVSWSISVINEQQSLENTIVDLDTKIQSIPGTLISDKFNIKVKSISCRYGVVALIDHDNILWTDVYARNHPN